MLIHWVQGAGLRGLSGMSLRREQQGIEILRPMLFLSGEAIGRYVRENKIPFRKDRSNDDPKFLRNRIRRLLKSLKRENPRLSEKSATASIFLKEDHLFIDSYLKNFLRKKTANLKNSLHFSRHLYKKSPASIRYRLWQAFYDCIDAESRGLDSEVVLKLDELALRNQSGHHYDLPGGLEVDFGPTALKISKHH